MGLPCTHLAGCRVGLVPGGSDPPPALILLDLSAAQFTSETPKVFCGLRLQPPSIQW